MKNPTLVIIGAAFFVCFIIIGVGMAYNAANGRGNNMPLPTEVSHELSLPQATQRETAPSNWGITQTPGPIEPTATPTPARVEATQAAVEPTSAPTQTTSPATTIQALPVVMDPILIAALRSNSKLNQFVTPISPVDAPLAASQGKTVIVTTQNGYDYNVQIWDTNLPLPIGQYYSAVAPAIEQVEQPNDKAVIGLLCSMQASGLHVTGVCTK